MAFGAGIVLGTLFRYWARRARLLPAGARAVLPELAKFGVVGAFAVLVSGAAVGLLSVQAGVRPLASAVAAALLATGCLSPGTATGLSVIAGAQM